LSRLWLYLGQYMSNEHNVLHGTWVTSWNRIRVKERKEKKRKIRDKIKTEMIVKTQNVHVYILLTQTRTVTYYMTDPFCRYGERPTTNKTATVLTTAKIWS
jgi:hypothetical protein